MAELHSFGLRPDTAFGCAVNFLFEPWPALMKPYSNIIEQVSSTTVLTIGIQIRIGDHVLADQLRELNLSTYKPFFECATAIERAHHVPGRRTYWLLIFSYGSMQPVSSQAKY